MSAREVEGTHDAEARRHAELLDLISVRLPKLDPSRARAAALMLGWSNALAEQAVTFDEYLLSVSRPEPSPSFPLAPSRLPSPFRCQRDASGVPLA